MCPFTQLIFCRSVKAQLVYEMFFSMHFYTGNSSFKYIDWVLKRGEIKLQFQNIYKLNSNDYAVPNLDRVYYCWKTVYSYKSSTFPLRMIQNQQLVRYVQNQIFLIPVYVLAKARIQSCHLKFLCELKKMGAYKPLLISVLSLNTVWKLTFQYT